MKKIINLVKKAIALVKKAISLYVALPKDKLLHIIAGALITMVVCLFPCLRMWGFLFGILAGLIKETVDVFKPEDKFDIKDWLATSIGAMAVQLLVWVIII